MKKEYIIAIACFVIILIGIGVLVINNKKEEKPIISEKEIINLGHHTKSIYEKENYVFTDYDDYKSKINDDKIKESDFKDANYALVPIEYDSCSETNIEIADYRMDDNKINVTIEYEGKCGVCAPAYQYYLLPISKKITTVDVNLDFKMTNKVDCDPNIAYKPMIYLYPTKTIDVSVKLGNSEFLTTTYPKYIDSWEVTANPDGTLINKKTNRSFYGLYWEGNNHQVYTQKDGFIVKGEDTIDFLEEKLSILGLNEREANEFIIYWLPKLENNKYNYIRFETIDEINNYMPLDITPKPDTVIRILMDYKPLDEYIEIEEQKLTAPERKGFTVVEWGGSIIK